MGSGGGQVGSGGLVGRVNLDQSGGYTPRAWDPRSL